MSRSALRPLPSLDVARAAALEARLAPIVQADAVRRRLAAHVLLAASLLLVAGWPIAALWLPLAAGLTLWAAAVGRQRLARRAGAAGTLERLLPAASAYGSPAALALAAAAFGGLRGLAAAGFMFAGLAVQALGQGDLAACRRWVRRQGAKRAPAAPVPRPARA
ncbi:MAG TPA: hypothetical protein VHK87_00390, partial [Phenylobacterium sp.]|nr:hypothetical protein [Phenylobacterium sp.]